MSNKYDSVLKEKKKYEEVIDDRHFLRKHNLGINCLAVIVILVISFIIYFFTILDPAKMVYDDFFDFFNSIDVVYKNILLDNDFNGKYNFDGEFDVTLETNYDNKDDVLFLNDLNFKYSILDDGINKSVNIDGEKYSFKYYEDNNNGYLNYDDNFIQYDLVDSKYSIEDYESILSKINNLFYQEIEKLNWEKSVFVSDEKLVVSLNLNLDGSYINEMYSRIVSEVEKDNIVIPNFMKVDKLVSDSVKYQINIKNDLFKNNLLNLKVIVNDNNYRGVLTYKGDTFTYKDDNNEYRCVLKVNDKDFSFRFYEGDAMRYILSGSGNDNSYVYTYQVINIVDNMSLQIRKDNNKNDYVLTIKKENEDKYFNLLVSGSLNYSNYVSIDDDATKNDYKMYSGLEEQEKEEIDNYVYRLFHSLSNLFNFVK